MDYAKQLCLSSMEPTGSRSCKMDVYSEDEICNVRPSYAQVVLDATDTCGYCVTMDRDVDSLARMAVEVGQLVSCSMDYARREVA